MIVITGATGHIGSKITEHLASLGKEVVAISRNTKNAKFFKDLGVELAVGDIGDTIFLTNTFTGADVVFAMIPPNYTSNNFRKYMNQMADSIVEAIQSSGVKYVVALSSLGAHLPENNGIVQGLYDFEQKLSRLNTNIIILRPAMFMENFENTIAMIKQLGFNGSSLKKDVKIPLAATKDTAKIASEYLTDLNFNGHTIEYVLGPKDYTPEEITQIIGKAIGRDLSYVEFSYQDSIKGMISAGMSQSNAQGLVDLDKSINEGIIIPEGIRNNKNTTATRLEDFSKEFKNVYATNTSQHVNK